MRKIGMLIVLMIVAAFGIDTASASAANCTGVAQPITRGTSGGYQVVSFYASIQSCTQVEAVQWYWRYNTSSTGFADCTETNPTCTDHQAYINGTQSDWVLNNPGSGINSVFVSQTCWYVGNHNLSRHFYWRIKSSATHTWGAAHVTSTGTTSINCF